MDSLIGAFVPKHKGEVIAALEALLVELNLAVRLEEDFSFETDTHEWLGAIHRRTGSELDKLVGTARDVTIEKLKETLARGKRVQGYLSALREGVISPMDLTAIGEELMEALVLHAIVIGITPLPSETYEGKHDAEDLAMLTDMMTTIRVYACALKDGYGVALRFF